MTEADVAGVLRAGVMVMLKTGGPPLFVGLVVGLIVAVLQAVTQINEATLAFVPKAIAVAATFILLGSFMMTALADYTRLLFSHLVAIGGS